MNVDALLQSLGVSPRAYENGGLLTCSPIDGSLLGKVHSASLEEVAHTVGLERRTGAGLWRRGGVEAV